MIVRTRSLYARRAIVLVAVAAMVGTIVGVATAAPATEFAKPEQGLDLARMSGTGERLILVVAGAYDTEEAAARATSDISFGDMAGFYVDAAENYKVIGYYAQDKPDAVGLSCDDVPKTAGECVPGSSIVAHQPVSLEYHGLVDAPGLLTARSATGCDTLGQLPCTAKRLLGLLSQPQWQFKPGQYLLLSVFRTRHGAEEFAELARDRGATIAVVRAFKLGGPYVGLGQESHPDGVSGPLLDPLSDPDQYQR